MKRDFAGRVLIFLGFKGGGGMLGVAEGFLDGKNDGFIFMILKLEEYCILYQVAFEWIFRDDLMNMIRNHA